MSRMDEKNVAQRKAEAAQAVGGSVEYEGKAFRANFTVWINVFIFRSKLIFCFCELNT